MQAIHRSLPVRTLMIFAHVAVTMILVGSTATAEPESGVDGAVRSPVLPYPPHLVTEAAKCTSAADYADEDSEWADVYNDDGVAYFSAIDVPAPLGYVGQGGHEGEVLLCTKTKCSGGWLPVVSDFIWGGGSVLGQPASIVIESAERLTPIVFKTCAGRAWDLTVAQSKSRSLHGTFAASAQHGGIGVPESSGTADLTADANVAGAYSYSWQYAGSGSLLGVDGTVRDAVDCENIPQICQRIPYLGAVDVHGAGADQDLLTFLGEAGL